MGLLSDGSLEENLKALEIVFEDVLDNWDRHISLPNGFSVEIGRKSLSRICLIGDQLFDDHTFPSQPGPFKRAAAVCGLSRMFIEAAFLPMQRGESISNRQKLIWTSRLALATVPVTLFLMTADLDGDSVKLTKKWVPATNHLQIELLNFLRWLDRPIVHIPTAGPDAPESIDLNRLHRTVMALSMIVEQSYYLVDAKVQCDVMHKSRNCVSHVAGDDDLWQDLTLFVNYNRNI